MLSNHNIQRSFEQLLAYLFPSLAHNHFNQLLALSLDSYSSLTDAFFNLETLIESIALQYDHPVPPLPDLLDFDITTIVLRQSLHQWLEHHYYRYPADEREEVIQESLTRTMLSAPSEIRSQPKKLFNYAKTCATRLLQYEHNRINRFAPFEEDLYISQLPNPELVAAQRLYVDAMQRWITERYGKLWCSLFLKFMMKQMKLKNIAEQYGISIATAHRYMKKIRNDIQQNFPPPPIE